MKRKSIICIIAITIFVLLSIPQYAAETNETITSTINLINVTKNESGPGYYWANRTDTLTLTNLNIDTKDDYGFKIPKDATVILEGTNTITAGKYALLCSGNTTFKGSGSLALKGGEIGLYSNLNDERARIMILDGTYNIEGGEYGIRSKFIPFVISGGIHIISGGINSINARSVKLGHSIITAKGGILSERDLTLNALDLVVNSDNQALIYGTVSGSLSISEMDIKTGSVSENLADAENYNGEAAFSSISTYKKVATSVIFGQNYPAALDWILLVLMVLITSSAIGIPVYLRYKKTEMKKKKIDEYK